MSVTFGHHQYGKAETRVVRVHRETDFPAQGLAFDPSQGW